MVKVSIIICTRDRAEALRQTLDLIGRTKVPDGMPVELLVVDNGSTDHTFEVVKNATIGGIPIRHVFEPRKGKGYAYNAGMAQAKGEVLLFTDDDVRVPIDWIAGMCRPIIDGAADAVAGGVVFPAEYAVALSRLVVASRRSWFASTEELNPNHPVRMVGANMAFHRRILNKVPKFDLELGPGASGFGDETLFSLQLVEAGYKLIGAFDIAVEHHFDLARLTGDGLLDMARKMGRSHAFLFHHWEHERSRLVIPRLLLCHLRRFWARCFDRRNDKDDGDVSGQVLRLEQELAFYREYIVQRRRGFKYPLRGLVPQVPEA